MTSAEASHEVGTGGGRHGFPYDLIITTVLHQLMVGWRGAEVGDYHHHVDFLHLTVQHQETACHLSPDAPVSPVRQLLGMPWEDFDLVVKQVTMGEAVGHPVWDGFAAVLASYRLWKAGRRDEVHATASEVPGRLPADPRWRGEEIYGFDIVIHNSG